mgnify:CR=1 FL=1
MGFGIPQPYGIAYGGDTDIARWLRIASWSCRNSSTDDLCGLQGDTRKNDLGVTLDGHSLRPLLQDPSNGKWDGPEGALTMRFAGPQTKNDIHKQHWSYRTERYRYIRYNNGKEELYDHQQDPYEFKNLASFSKYKEFIFSFTNHHLFLWYSNLFAKSLVLYKHLLTFKVLIDEKKSIHFISKLHDNLYPGYYYAARILDFFGLER